MTSDISSVFSLDYWKKDSEQIIKKFKVTQYQYYKRNNAPIEVLNIVSMESKRFGSVGEKLIALLLQLQPRTSTENDKVRKNKKIEIKCSRYWAGKNECKWQHIEEDYDYDCVLFALLDFDGTWKVWAIKKSFLTGELKQKKIVTHQGKEGHWCNKSKVTPYCTEIKNITDFDEFLDTI